MVIDVEAVRFAVPRFWMARATQSRERDVPTIVGCPMPYPAWGFIVDDTPSSVTVDDSPEVLPGNQDTLLDDAESDDPEFDADMRTLEAIASGVYGDYQELARIAGRDAPSR